MGDLLFFASWPRSFYEEGSVRDRVCSLRSSASRFEKFRKKGEEIENFCPTLDSNIFCFLLGKFKILDPIESAPCTLQLSLFERVKKGNKIESKKASK